MQKSKILNANLLASIDEAAAILKNGGVVAFPTETVYGLGADAFNVSAVCRIFEVKKRPSFDPLIVHVAKPEEAMSLWRETPKIALDLIQAFWPGPLTIVLPKKERVPDVVTAGMDTVAVRMPNHPAALKLIESLGNPIAAPSANLFGYTSPTTAGAVFEDLGESVDLILDAGPTKVGLESTVLKFENGKVVLLRPGGTMVEAIEKFTPVLKNALDPQTAYESPGRLKVHYAPWTSLSLIDEPFDLFLKKLSEVHEDYERKKIPWPRLGLLSLGEKKNAVLFQSVEVLSPKGDWVEAASNLFKAIRNLDKMNLDLIIAERVPERGIGLAIMDRLTKASGGKTGLGGIFGDRTSA